MLLRAHFAIGVFASIFFFPHVSNGFIFISVVLLSSVLPEIDNGLSALGKLNIFRSSHSLGRHRGLFHSFTLGIGVATISAFYFPSFAFAFYLGFSLHILVDSFTSEGIRPFWPLRLVLKGRIRDGGYIDQGVFLIFVALSVIFLILLLV